MNDEERQRQMDFIVHQQAQFTIQLSGLTEKVQALADSQHRAEQRWARTEEGIRGLLVIAEIHEREIEALRESGRESNERLDALINTVERIISERRDGGPGQA